MRILILTNFGLGLYKFRKELLIRLCKNNDVFVGMPNSEYDDKIQKLGCSCIGISIDRRGMNPLSDLKLMFSYVKLIYDTHPDLVLTYTIKPNVYGGMACRITRTSYISNITGLGTSIENGGWLGKLSLLLYRIGLKKANCVFFQNSNNQQMFHDKKVINGHNRIIPGSGVNLASHAFEEYPSEKDGIRFLFIGRIMKDKGINELLKAITKIHKKYKTISLDIIGVYDENYDSVIANYCSGGFIRFHGMQNDVRPFIKNAHCTILPSYHEGTANVILESAATGRPVITTRVPGCIETFDEDITGIGCEAKSTESLISAIEKFLRLSPGERRNMGLKGREKMCREYDRCIVVDAYIEEIENLKKGECNVII